MKKIIALMLAVLLLVGMTACGAKKAADGSDLAYVKEKGKLVVGITDFAPMDYKDDAGNWIGFDADMAKAFAKELGVECEFVEINWDTKINELDSKSIDAVWNGMTLTDEVKKGMETSNPYCNNAQVIVVKADKAEEYALAESCKALNFAVESGSAGESAVAAKQFNYVPVTTQADALMEVSSGTSDACVIDLLMAGAMIGEGTSYEDLAYTDSLTTEEYGVGFRKGSDLAAALNDFFVKAYADGSMMATAEQYGVQESIVEQK